MEIKGWKAYVVLIAAFIIIVDASIMVPLSIALAFIH